MRINADKEKALHLAQTIGCQMGGMLFTYLGLPLGTTRPLVEEFFFVCQQNRKKNDGHE
jgi:hypothetical protein